MGQIHELWQALGVPGEADTITRVKWCVVSLIVFLFAGLWTGQFALGSTSTYYPAERLRLSAAWSLIIYALFLTAMLGAGWYVGGQATWGAVSIHIPLLVASLLIALLIVPARPRLTPPR